MSILADGMKATVVLLHELTQTRPDRLRPIVYEGNGVLRHEAKLSSPGLTIVQGLLPGGPQVRLIDMSGRELHRWNVDFFNTFPNPSHIYPPKDVPKSKLNYHTQGFVAQPDGSILVNIGAKGAAKLDKCGKVLWTVDRMTHHLITGSPGGGYYLPGHTPINQIPDRRLPPRISREHLEEVLEGNGANPDNVILKVDDAGNVVHELSVMDAILDAGLEAAIFDARVADYRDPTHLNDIEIVTPALAAKIAGVEQGDLLISLRNMNMLAIVDKDDGSLKWHKRGPWVWQHDTDITPSGRIELFNNRHWLIGLEEGGSQILAYDPETGRVDQLYPVGERDKFATDFLGSHQRLPNGNRLIVESVAGRVIEVTPDGTIVWAYVLPYDTEYAALIEHAERVPEDFFNVSDWGCD